MSILIQIIGQNIVLFGVAWYVLSALGYWNMFVKAGEAGWKAFIPLYNTYMQYKICWKPSRFFIMLAAMWASNCLRYLNLSGIPLTIAAYICLAVYVGYSLNKSFRMAACFGKGTLYGLGLLILTPIFSEILGFGSAEFVGKPDYVDIEQVKHAK